MGKCGNHDDLLFIVNLGILLATGVGLTVWMYFFTDYFPVASVVAGGLVAWVAAIFNLVPSAKAEIFKKRLSETILGNCVALVVLLLACLAVSYRVSGRGTLVIESADAERRQVSVMAALGGEMTGCGTEPITKAEVRPSQPRRLSVWVGFSGESTLCVKARGYPVTEVSLAWMELEPLRLPRDFQRRVVLLRSSEGLAADAASGGYMIEVKYDGKKILEQRTYTAELIWIGCDKDVPLPPEVERKDEDERMILSPAPHLVLQQGKEIKVVVWNEKGEVRVDRSFTVEEYDGQKDFRQVESLSVPSGGSAGSSDYAGGQ